MPSPCTRVMLRVAFVVGVVIRLGLVFAFDVVLNAPLLPLAIPVNLRRPAGFRVFNRFKSFHVVHLFYRVIHIWPRLLAGRAVVAVLRSDWLLSLCMVSPLVVCFIRPELLSRGVMLRQGLKAPVNAGGPCNALRIRIT